MASELKKIMPYDAKKYFQNLNLIEKLILNHWVKSLIRVYSQITYSMLNFQLKLKFKVAAYFNPNRP